MSSLVRSSSLSDLTQERLQNVLAKIRLKLEGRVREAYVFGSVSTGDFTRDSDIDLILVVESPARPFVERGFDFLDLFGIYPRLDLLVYTQQELQAQLGDSDIGFWKSVRLTMKRIV